MVENGARKKNQRKVYSIGIISMIIIFIMSTSKWLIEGILDKPIIEAFVCLAVLIMIFLVKGMKIRKNALVWLLYIINILLSLFTHSSTLELWGRGGVTILTTALVLFINEPIERYSSVLKMIYFFGLINAGLVIFHYLAGNTFEHAYLSRLNETARLTAKLYIRNGYYFGLLYNPHEPASLIAFSMVAILIRRVVNEKHKLMSVAFCFFLIVPILMTGKKAVFVCAVFAFVVIIMALFGSQKQFIKSFIFVFIIISVAILFINFTLTHPEIAFFNRFNLFFQNIIMGNSVGLGRIVLYQRAIEEWENHKLLGIGWRQFNALTVDKFQMTQSHEVNCDYLQWLCETGIIGFILSIVPVMVMTYRTFYVCRRKLNLHLLFNDSEKLVILMAGYIQIFTIIYASVEIPFFDIVNFTMYIISCIIINSAYCRSLRA